MKQQITSLKGTRDWYPADQRGREVLLQPLAQTMELYGYEKYDAPILESLALYAAKSSLEIIERQSYVFEDRGGEKVVVRPEMTPSLARLVANKQRELPPLLRWYTIADCWRYERPQKGRLRNFLQLNVDLIGSDTAEADAEVLLVAQALLRSLRVDLSRIEIRLNDRRLLDGWLEEADIPVEKRSSVLSLLDEKTKLEPENFRAQLEALVSSSSATALLDRLEQPLEALLQDSRAVRLREVTELLRESRMDIRVCLDPTIIRGFAYYTGLVFEVYETSGVFRRAIFGGGRYDRLVQDVGGSPVSGIGFGVSDVSLEETLRAQEKQLLDPGRQTVMLIPYSLDEASVQRLVATRLRSEGVPVVTSLPPYGFREQLTMARKQGIPLAVLLTAEEWGRECVLLRDLRRGEQVSVALPELASACRQVLSN